MTQHGFEEYLYSQYGQTTGAADSYIRAIQIIDRMFTYDDPFGLDGKSLTSIDDTALLLRITEFVSAQLALYKKGEDSIFRNIGSRQTSYPRNGFCLAAIKHLLEYSYSLTEKAAEVIVSKSKRGTKVAKDLNSFFDLDREGTEVEISARARVGQDYFRKMVLANYESKCCVCGLNVPITLRASHIVAWKADKTNRMNPENGLCLSATYDAAFDKHLISFDEDYRMIVSKEIKEYYTNDVTKEYFKDFEGKQITLPKLFLPSQKLLEKHRNLLVG